jgi:hypothetical protein
MGWEGEGGEGGEEYFGKACSRESHIPSTGKSSNSSSSSRSAVLACVGFEVVAASAGVDLEVDGFVVEDMADWV